MCGDRNRRGLGGSVPNVTGIIGVQGGSDPKCIVSGQNAEVLQGSYEVSGEKYSSFSYKVLLHSRPKQKGESFSGISDFSQIRLLLYN